MKFSSDQNNLSFSVDSRMMGELGEKLVTNNYLALVELIKNSYDADSKSVEITFKDVLSDLKDQKGSIIIKDFGRGMTYEDVKKYWMRVSTPHKENKPYSSEYFRPVTGNKGIGRFACQRLAKRMVMRAISDADSNGYHEVTKAIFHWRDFTSGSELNEVACKSFRYKRKNLKKGLTLKLNGLNEQWLNSHISIVQRRLVSLSLASPKFRKITVFPSKGNKSKTPINIDKVDFDKLDNEQLLVEDFNSDESSSENELQINEMKIEDPGFNILINASHLDDQIILKEKVLDAGWCSLIGRTKPDGTVEVNFNAKLLGSKKYIVPKKYPAIKGSEIEIHYFPETKEAFRNSALINNEQLKDMIKNDSGIKVYSEGFRVYPYGEPQDDWLSLDADVARRKAKIDNDALSDIATGYGLIPGRTMLSLPRNRSLFGSITLEANRESNFQIKLNREGFVENEASKQLTELTRFLVEWITVNYERYKRIKNESDVDESREKIKETNKNLDNRSTSNDYVNAALESINKFVDLTQSNDSKVLVKKEISDATNLIQSEFRSKETELTMLRYIASSAPLLFVFAHEMKNLLSELDTNAGLLENFAENSQFNHEKRLIDMAINLRNSKKRFLSVEKLITVFSSSHKVEKKIMLIEDVIIDVINGFEFVTNEHDIKITYDVSSKLLKTRKMAESAIYSVFVNIISNAIKAVLASNDDGKLIHIKAERQGNLIIQFMDNGIGLDKGNWDIVFQPLESDPSGELYRKLTEILPGESLEILGKGSGLGLNIVKSIVQTNKGEVYFSEPDKNWKTMIEVTLP